MLIRWLIVLLAFLPVPAAAQDLAGSWALRIEGTTIFRFDIETAGDGWKGTWWKPRSFASDGNNFGRLVGPPIEVTSGSGRALGEWAELSFPDPRPNAVPDVFRFRMIGGDRVEMIYADTGLAPYELVRVVAKAPLGPWEADKVYRRPGAPIAEAPPPALSGRDDSSRIWSLPATAGAAPARTGSAAPSRIPSISPRLALPQGPPAMPVGR
jgi:hypothetical protein